MMGVLKRFVTEYSFCKLTRLTVYILFRTVFSTLQGTAQADNVPTNHSAS